MQKGQYTIVEEVILISIGVAIALGFILTFTTFTDDVKETEQDRQVDTFANLIAFYVTKVYRVGPTASITFELPESIAGSAYTVVLNDENVRIFVANGVEARAPVYGIGETIALSGEIQSNFPRGKLTYSQKQIILQGSG